MRRNRGSLLKGKPKHKHIIFTPEQFGAVGNGITDATLAFQNMNAAILSAQNSNPEIRVKIDFATNAHYVYTTNRWSWGIRHLTIEGNGATIQNTLNSVWSGQMMTWWTNPSVVQNNQVHPRGFLVNTALPGSTSVTLKDIQYASEFVVGRWIVVASYSQQVGGWPPNARYFDYAKVTAINGATITFDRPIVHEHRDDWITRGYVDEIDKARVIPAERDVPWGAEWFVRNLTALENPNWPGGGVVQIEGIDVATFENVNFPQWSAGQMRKLIFRNSTFPWAEPDKMMTHLRIENSNCSFAQCTGVDLVEMIGCTSRGIQCAARRLYVDGCTFHATGIAGPPIQWWDPLSVGSISPVEYVEVRNTSFNSGGHPDWPALAGVYTLERALGTAGFALSGTDIIVDQNYIEFWNNDGFGTRIYEGQRIRLVASDRSRKGHGTIVSIRDNGGPFTARIVVNWSVSPVPGDIVIQYGVMELIGINNTLIDTYVSGAVPNRGIAYTLWNGELIKDVWTVSDS